MAATDVIARLDRVRRHLERVFQILVMPSPQALEASRLLLAAALAELEDSRPSRRQSLSTPRYSLR